MASLGDGRRSKPLDTRVQVSSISPSTSWSYSPSPSYSLSPSVSPSPSPEEEVIDQNDFIASNGYYVSKEWIEEKKKQPWERLYPEDNVSANAERLLKLDVESKVPMYIKGQDGSVFKYYASYSDLAIYECLDPKQRDRFVSLIPDRPNKLYSSITEQEAFDYVNSSKGFKVTVKQSHPSADPLTYDNGEWKGTHRLEALKQPEIAPLNKAYPYTTKCPREMEIACLVWGGENYHSTLMDKFYDDKILKEVWITEDIVAERYSHGYQLVKRAKKEYNPNDIVPPIMSNPQYYMSMIGKWDRGTTDTGPR